MDKDTKEALERIEGKIEAGNERTQRIEAALISGLDDKPGLFERMRSMERWKAGISAIGITTLTLAAKATWEWAKAKLHLN